jgi:hypothetical protein
MIKFKFVAVFENNWWSLTLAIIPDYTLAGLKELHVLRPLSIEVTY